VPHGIANVKVNINFLFNNKVFKYYKKLYMKIYIYIYKRNVKEFILIKI